MFITYFKNEMREPPGGMVALARREWERVTSVEELRKLVKAAREHLSEEDYLNLKNQVVLRALRQENRGKTEEQ